MNLRILKIAVPALLLTAIFAIGETGKSMTIKGYVLDSACAFTKGLKKPVSAECAIACAKAGSPLVILTSAGTIYWPIADTTPSSSQNDKLLEYAGKEVTVSGKVFQRGGSTAIVISKVEPLSEKKTEMK
jgi:uncharacterized membrane protein YcgQ (UPF0703/DUF1980 family)